MMYYTYTGNAVLAQLVEQRTFANEYQNNYKLLLCHSSSVGRATHS